MRVASENEMVGLSEWRKIEIIDDTLYFESFGEWKEDLKARVDHISKNNLGLRILENENEFTINLMRVTEKIDFENQKEFWKEFKNRRTKRGCK